MWNLLLKWLVSYFTADRVGVIIRLILSKAGDIIIAKILDAVNQKKALSIVQELNKNTQLSNEQKAEKFNEEMKAWSKEQNQELPDSAVNCLREMAVVASKEER